VTAPAPLPPATRAVAAARAFLATAVTHWWSSISSHPVRPPPPHANANANANDLAARASALPLPDALHLLGTTYASLLPSDLRRRHGIFYTPPALVDRLLDASDVDWRRARILDPACGAGAFLAAAAARCLTAVPASQPERALADLAGRLRAVELDPFAAWLARVAVDAAVHAALGAPPDPSWDPIVVVGDALDAADDDGESFDLVVGNPPYGRVRLSPERRARYRRSLHGHANLYGLFLDLALRRLRPGGRIAFVAPPSFLAGEYFKNLRALLAAQAPPRSLEFLADRAGVFDGVLQETLLAVFARPVTAVDATAASAGGPWIVARTADSTPLAARLRAMPDRLADWGYRVSTGPLVWNRHKPALRARRTRGAVPLIWAEAVGGDGRFAFRALRRNHAPYLHIAGARDRWLLVSAPCVLVQRTTSKEQARRLVAAPLPASFLRAHGPVTVENHLNMVLSLTPRPAVSPAALAAFLNSAAADRAFRCLSGTVAVSAYELESLPLPPAAELRPLEALLRRRPRREAIEALCAQLYRVAAIDQ
jgi:adenine-specific DNA-methyltransferase